MVHETSKPREIRRQKRIRAILDHAMDAIHSDGIEGVTVHGIARELDLTVGALYRYFPSKAAIIAQLEREAVLKIDARLRAAVTPLDSLRPSDDPTWSLAIIHVLAQAYGQFAREEPASFRLIGLIMAEPNHLLTSDDARTVFETVRELFGFIAERITRAEDFGALSPGNAMDRTVLLWSGLRAVSQTRKLVALAPDTIRGEHLFETMLHTLLRGWGASPEAVLSARDLAQTISPLPAMEPPP